MADDVDDVKAVVREYFATLNAGNQDAHLQQHHMAQYNRFTTGGLRWHFDSIEEQQQQTTPHLIRAGNTISAFEM